MRKLDDKERKMRWLIQWIYQMRNEFFCLFSSFHLLTGRVPRIVHGSNRIMPSTETTCQTCHTAGITGYMCYVKVTQ